MTKQLINELLGRGWTKEALGAELGVHRNTIRRWANGETPEQEKLVRAALERLMARRRVPKQRRYGKKT